MAATAVAALAGLPGCSLEEQAVLVAGHDERGTLVVGAAFCTSDATDDVDNLVVTDPTRNTDLWAIGLSRHGADAQAIEPPPPAPAPDPAMIGDLAMVAVGDPDPPFGALVVALEDPLPSRPLTVIVEGTDPWDPAVEELTVEAEGEPDTYQVAQGEEGVVDDLDAASAAAVVRRHRDDDGGDIVVAGLVTAGVATGVVGVLFVIAVLVAIRQYRRAGVAVAEAAARRRGW